VKTVVEYDEKHLQYLNIFEGITGVVPISIEEIDDTLFVSVPFFKIKQVIGEKGKNIERLTKRFGKKIYVYSHTTKLREFVRNFLNNVKIISMDVEDVMGEKVIYLIVDERYKKKALGVNKIRLKALKHLLKKNFNTELVFRTKVIG